MLLEALFRASLRLRGPGYIIREFTTWSHRMGAVYVLRALGATIGERSYFDAGLRIQNATNGNCSSLVVGDDVWVGPEVLIDVQSAVTLETEVTVAGRASFITHQNVGSGPLRESFPPRSGEIVIHTGSFIGFAATVLPGVRVGPLSVIGAGSVVVSSVPPHMVAVGIPARVTRSTSAARDEA